MNLMKILLVIINHTFASYCLIFLILSKDFTLGLSDMINYFLNRWYVFSI